MSLNKKPFVIGIAGGSGSGKTFFLNCFLHHFKQDEVTLVSQDDYYIPAGDMTQEENKLYNFDLPSTIDSQQFLKDIKQLLNGEVVYKKEYNFNNPLAVVKILEIKSAPIIIVEGLFILHFKEISGLLDHTIFVDADEQVALDRRVKRDGLERGYPEDDVIYKWHNHVVPAYKEYLLPYREGCNKVVMNNTNEPDELITITEEISNELRNNILVNIY
ncbi:MULTISPECIES: uridine kinase family protein [unclassified Pedobacter]|jgi:uridine kinase|uniref:uridine kinase family protein n=1 Tax=unclassified Pedobacter TaxID=2628915 RepID=UPI000B4C182C|nr:MULTISPECIES: P-loop NTPase fold protein [unclassified Pedobacter]MCX2430689.1 uridine kinase [Pedobacter sp. GR22-10]MCX2584110.1 uridine kinase [Pedobacter sp. MR22-3]OWK69034.1 uridine kinase [Pedobacter sp. AJM]